MNREHGRTFDHTIHSEEMANIAKRALIPLENRRQFPDVTGDVAERMDPIVYSDAQVAVNKALSIG
jgi:ATP-dependent Lon protease